jgi:hypothetical protein
LRAGGQTLDDMTVAADPDPYFALPALYGAPAYARPPRTVPDSERPPDPDDLPLAVEQTDEERALVEEILGPDGVRAAVASGSSLAVALGRSGNGTGAGRAGGSNGSGPGRFSLRRLTGRHRPDTK